MLCRVKHFLGIRVKKIWWIRFRERLVSTFTGPKEYLIIYILL